MRSLYSATEPVKRYFFERNGQRLSVEEYGNPVGIPVLFLHGGPGSGCRAEHSRYFDPARFRIFLHDQRGSGRSIPGPGLSLNTTQEIITDLELIREQCAVDQWLLFGGSWGATLSLLYAEQVPHRIGGMVLRGTFLARSEDLDWFLGSEGVARVYPEAWRVFLGATGERGGDVFSLIESLYRKIRSEDRGQSWQIAQAWEQWGGIVTLGNPTRAPVSFDEGTAAELVRKARIELHYAQSAYFIRENQILDEIERVLAIPTVIIHGGKDLVCSPRGAVMLHEAHPNSMLRILEDSGHVPNDEAMISALIEAVEAVAQNGFNL